MVLGGCSRLRWLSRRLQQSQPSARNGRCGWPRWGTSKSAHCMKSIERIRWTCYQRSVDHEARVQQIVMRILEALKHAGQSGRQSATCCKSGALNKELDSTALLIMSVPTTVGIDRKITIISRIRWVRVQTRRVLR
jgi:hypothetical protein